MSIGLPSLTVVTPSLNQGEFLERTIRSVLDQDYPDLQYIVMDGGSTDGSLDIIHRFAHRLDHWVSAPDGGQSAAINAGWRLARGAVVTWLNSDDFYLPGALARVGAFLGSHPDVMVAYGRGVEVDRAGRPLRELGWPYRRRTMIFSRNVIPQPAAFIRRDAIATLGMLDESLHYMMDLDLFLRIGAVKEPEFIDVPIAGMTSHRHNKTTRDRNRMARERWAVRLRHARSSEVPMLRMGQAASYGFHHLPSPLRTVIDRVRRG